MKRLTKLLDRLRGLTNAISRHPLTAAFLLATSVMIAISINTGNDYAKQILTGVVGSVLCASLQVTYERFFNKRFTRLILMGGGVILTSVYYLMIRPVPDLSMEIGIRTSIALFTLILIFIWVPTIRNRISFNESFLVVFKSYFHSALFAAVIFMGCNLIIVAINILIVDVGDKAYSYTANIIFVLFAPIFFLSLIPVYSGKKEEESKIEKRRLQDEMVKKAASCPKFLEVLISYIIIPLTAMFTVILLLYIILNIRGAFWTNNLLEPMLVSYAITVILVYILSSTLDNKFAIWFRLIFPKVLVPIVLFQIASSVISLRDTGITHTRYFVILFGVFAASAGVVMSFVSVQKNGIIAAMLISFSLVSIIPPIDAFTVSRISQENTLKEVLLQNEMFDNNTITPKDAISDEDKKKIILSAEYLSMMGYTEKIQWMPEHFVVYEDFYDTFGFNEYDLPEKNNGTVYVFLKQSEPVDIAGYDILARTYINEENMESSICNIEKAGKSYALTKEKVEEHYDIVLLDDDQQEVIRFNTDEIFSRYRSYAVDKSEIAKEEAIFTTENNNVKITFVVQEANINVSYDRTYYFVDLYILVQFK